MSRIPTREIGTRFLRAAMLTTMTCVPLAAIFLYTTSVPRSYPPLLPMQIISGTIGGAVLVALGYSLLNTLIAHVKLRHTLLIGFGVLLLLLRFNCRIA